MHIGKALRVVVVEPTLQLPVNQAPRTSPPLPAVGAQPPLQPELVPAK